MLSPGRMSTSRYTCSSDQTKWPSLLLLAHEPVAPLLSSKSSTRLQIDTDIAKEDGFHVRPSIKLPIPDHIKSVLVDDWENVTKNNQLVPLPHPHPVDEIINDYLNYERPSRDPESPHLDILLESMAGLKEYFDKALGRILLYRYISRPCRRDSQADTLS